MQVAQYFDDIYRKHDRYWWQGEERYSLSPEEHSHSLLTQVTLRLLNGRAAGRALDLGAGEGDDAIRLALLGYQVDAIDISEVAAGKISDFATKAGVEINVMAGDIADYIPAGPYDVLICNGVLHYVEDKASVVTRMQEVTRPGGLNVISLWSTYTPVPDSHNHNKVPIYADDEQGTVIDLYSEWITEFIYFERDKPEGSHSDLPPHRHSHIKLVARKPGT